MNPAEIARLLEHVTRRWPHAQLPADSGDVWLQDLADVPADQAQAAVGRWALAGEQFPPTSGWVLAEVERAAQTDAPSFDQLQAWLAKHARLLPYGDRNTPADTALAVATLAEAGAHEALLRFVAANGVYAARMMPDPSLQPLDLNQQADRRDIARDYRGRVLIDWRNNPTAGVALERACRTAQLDPVEIRELAAERIQQLAPPARPALPAGDQAPEEDEPMVEFDVQKLIADHRAERSRARAAEQADLKQRREQERAERHAAEAELAEHAIGRTGGGR